MKDILDGINKIADTFFNGRPASGSSVRKAGTVTIQEMVRRKTSTVLVDGKLYRITVERVEVKP